MTKTSTIRSMPSVTNSSEGSASLSNSSKEDDGFQKLHRTLSTTRIVENMSRRVERDPYDIYKHAKILGTGSMVCR